MKGKGKILAIIAVIVMVVVGVVIAVAAGGNNGNGGANPNSPNGSSNPTSSVGTSTNPSDQPSGNGKGTNCTADPLFKGDVAGEIFSCLIPEDNKNYKNAFMIFLRVYSGDSGNMVWDTENTGTFVQAPGYPGGPPPKAGIYGVYYYEVDGIRYAYGWSAASRDWKLVNGELIPK